MNLLDDDLFTKKPTFQGGYTVGLLGSQDNSNLIQEIKSKKYKRQHVIFKTSSHFAVNLNDLKFELGERTYVESCAIYNYTGKELYRIEFDSKKHINEYDSFVILARNLTIGYN